MSTITVVKKDGVVAIACDTLTKYGTAKEGSVYIANHSKIIAVNGSYIGLVGPASAKLALQDYFASTDTEPSLNSIMAIFAVWKKLHQSLKDDYFLRPEENDEDSFESSRVDALIANAQGIFVVAAHRSVQELTRFYAVGSGAEYALGAMFVAYDNPEKSAEAIAKAGIEAAAEFDDSTGLPLIVHHVELQER